ncbi:ubiquitin carboxyl-terminal hydrolase 26 [Selaginella moellendorffii]|uniref:ubiquitin carboxyl-terminal hydrolase 26 n=1 Tax=Selaginella moellendorffii TaxID=88036 RepID=UPI000D1C9C7D|nr:ubiquitin carboxyl-terminal hydrolase 26 [Selaginella moellendorffii]|eukprot:XP_024527691.1 ubiquitin carboxyl-terminal hydrolase 26 [Selaginella moellendorffii]
MSGRTRNKNSKVPKGDRGAEILRRIHLTKIVTEEDLRWFFHLDRPACQGCRGNTKDNPLCLCGLVPPANGTRKHGLWQKLSDIIDELGPDPSRELRVMDIPAGLTNLGATCYVNSVLQCLFMNTTFRNGVFSAEMELVRNDPVLHQLARLFAQLHSGTKSSVDSAAFATTLELDNAVQQDGQEFLKLLLTLLERVLAQSRVPEARDVVQNLFRGTFSYVTKCSSCGKESGASDQFVDFYELEVNVKGFSSLEESLDDYLNEEKLSGENQYFCEYCKARVDATHSTKLRLLPPVLNFQLKRFVFNLKTSTKKKVTSKFMFPKVLDMERRVSPVTSDGSPGEPAHYDLFAILMHKGNMASSGHYVVHIRDERTGQWWQFDDEEVTMLGSNPLGEPTSKLDKVSPDRDDNLLMSPDAYMLMFSRRTSTPRVAEEPVRSIPEFLKAEVDEQNYSLMSSCEVYNLMKDEEEQRIVERRAEVREVLANARPTAPKGFWISAEWLRNWTDSLKPPSAIDNSILLCEHERVSPKSIQLMKCISDAAWQSLHSKYGGEPVLTMESCCFECIYADAGAAATAESFRSGRAAMKLMAENVMAGKGLEGHLFYVSKSWLVQWMRKKAALDTLGDGDLNPTSAITCRHNALLPDDAAGAKRQVVPEVLWSYFYQNAVLVGGEEQRGHKPFPVNTENCKICEAEHSHTLSRQNDLRATKMEQRQKQEAIFSGRNPVLNPGDVYYLVPSSWISLWRAYIGASGKNVLDIEEPVGLERFLSSLLCKHGGLLYNPPALTRTRRGELVQKASSDDVQVVVSRDDWVYFCQQWDANAGKGIRAYVEEAEMPDRPEKELSELKLPVLRTEPEVCRECIDDRETTELVHKLNYTNATITVDLVQGKEPPPSLVFAAANQDAERRTSKRARRTVATGNKQVKLTVSGTTTVYQLKMLIWEWLGVVKENQEVHFGKVELTDESTTLADVGVLPNSQLWVSDSGLHEHRDIADELSTPQQGHVEEGFRGTRLLDSCLPGPANGLHSSENQFLEQPGIC